MTMEEVESRISCGTWLSSTWEVSNVLDIMRLHLFYSSAHGELVIFVIQSFANRPDARV